MWLAKLGSLLGSNPGLTAPHWSCGKLRMVIYGIYLFDYIDDAKDVVCCLYILYFVWVLLYRL